MKFFSKNNEVIGMFNELFLSTEDEKKGFYAFENSTQTFSLKENEFVVGVDVGISRNSCINNIKFILAEL